MGAGEAVASTPGNCRAALVGEFRCAGGGAAISWPSMSDTKDAPAELAGRLVAGDRQALARAITLAESTRADHREMTEELLARVMARTGGAPRLGISGAPGVGKSTFIEAFGRHLTGLGRKVAVLAIDPSSARTGGSILGDKTRMAELARDPNAFIRPTPAAGSLGGVARRTREAMLLAEAAGFDFVLVETVGVGQSEFAVEEMVDCFVLLVSPGGGDELQGIKRGVTELADIVVVTKADGALEGAARHAVADYRAALGLLRAKHPAWIAETLMISAVEGRGIEAVADAVERHRASLEAAGAHRQRRADQACFWLWREVEAELISRLTDDAAMKEARARVEAEVAAGRVAPTVGARDLVRAFLDSEPSGPGEF